MIFKIFLIIFCLFLPLAAQGTVIINEIAWMGTEVNSSDEWIELYNNANQDINLDGWGLYEKGGETLIEPLTETIKAKSYYLVERTDDETVPDIEASQPPTSWGGHGLKNTGEHLQLLDNNSNIVDEVDCEEGWFAGKAKPEYKTMEKTDSGSWIDSENPGGTPKAENSSLPTQLAEEEKTEPAEDSPPLATPVSYPSGIVFNEILPSPEGPDAENEWIELYNQNDFDVDLSGWAIQDTTGSTKTYVLNVKIPANGYLVLPRPEAKITLNNAGDGLNLFNPNKEIVDSVDFGKASLGQSYNRTPSGWAWSTTLTPGAKNIVPASQIPEQKSKEKKSENGSLEADFLTEKGTADVSTITESSGFSTLLIAFVVAIFSGIAFLMVKSNLKDFWH